MKSGAVFLGLMASVLIVGNVAEQSPNVDQTIVAASVFNDPGSNSESRGGEWRLSVQSHAAQCTASFTVKDLNLVTSRTVGRCISLFPELESLTRIEIDPNGDISLFHRDGSKLASFMEAEASHHESFWPAHPLMTLARQDVPSR